MVIIKVNDIIDKNFFVIDSYNLNLIETKLIGYAIYKNRIITNENFEKNMIFDGTGAYVHIAVNNNDINIYQDFAGCFGLYFFKKGNYFAISNSFLKLVNHVKEKFEISLNYDYAISYITSDLCSFIYEDTLVNEIKIIPRNHIIHINKMKKEIYFEEFDYGENTIDLNSPEGIKTLDEWFIKWNNIIHNISNSSSNISCDLTGGIDSRATLSLLIASGIDLRNVEFNSYEHEVEDFNIASEIADDFNFELNKNLNVEYDAIPSFSDALNISFYTRLGFKNTFLYPPLMSKQLIYHFTGFGGEICRGFWGMGNIEDSIEYQSLIARNYSYEFENRLKIYHRGNFEKLRKNFNENLDYLRIRSYKETRLRYHFGRQIIEHFFMNSIYLNPLIDPLLVKLKLNNYSSKDDYSIVATIFDRYAPKLLNYEFEGNRKIKYSTLNYAKSINKKYPFKRRKFNTKRFFTKGNENVLNGVKPKYDLEYETKSFLRKLFCNPSFKKSFIKYFPEEVYNYVLINLKLGLRDVYSIISILNIIKDVEYSKENNYDNVMDWLENFSTIPIHPNFNSEIELGNVIFKIPPEFYVKSKNSITNGKISLYFNIVNNVQTDDLQSLVKTHMNRVKKEGGKFNKKIFSVNNIKVHKLINLKTNTVRYWFKLNNVIYQLYSFHNNSFLDSKIKYLLTFSIIKDKLFVGNIMFSLPKSYWIDKSNSITNGENSISFEIVDKPLNDANYNVKSYVDFIIQKNNDYLYESFKINKMLVHKVSNNNIIRYLFEKDNVIYQIYTDLENEYSINYLFFNMV